MEKLHGGGLLFFMKTVYNPERELLLRVIFNYGAFSAARVPRARSWLIKLNPSRISKIW